MNLEVNENDQGLNTNEFRRPSKTFTRTIAGVLTTVALYSGSILGKHLVNTDESSNNATISQDYEKEYLDTVVEIPEFYREQMTSLCDKLPFQEITIRDLLKIDKFIGSVNDEATLEFLNYCENIESLSLFVETLDTSHLKKLSGLKNIKEVNITATLDHIPKEKRTIVPTVNSTDFRLLSNCPNLETLTINGMAIEPGVVEALTSLKILSIDTDGNYDIDFSKLTFLDELEFIYEEPYTLAQDFTLDEYRILIDNDVNVVFADDAYLETFLRINKKLDSIVTQLGITEENTDQEKLDAILIYTLDNLKYDPTIFEMIENNEELEGKASEFYQGGTLYGALEKDTVICGNYAALVQALASRVNLSTHWVKSTCHAWNIVEVEGELYYVDPTMMDVTDFRIVGESEWRGEKTHAWAFYPATEAIAEKNTEYLEWYMEDPTKFGEKDESITHDAVNIPTYIKIKPIEKIENISSDSDEIASPKPINLTNTKFEVSIKDKTWTIAAGAAIGIMSSLGGAIALGNHDKRRAKKRVSKMNDIQERFLFDDLYTSNMISTNDGGLNYSYEVANYSETERIFENSTTNILNTNGHIRH